MQRITRRRALALGLAAAATGNLEPARAETTADGVLRYDRPLEFRVTHCIEFERGDLPLSTLEVWLPVPQDLPEQTIADLEIKPRTPVVRDPKGAAAAARIVMQGVPRTPAKSVVLSLSYRVTRRETTANREAATRAAQGAYRKDSVYEYYTRPEKRIEVEAPAIQAAAKELGGANRSPLETALAAYHWVIERTKYQPIEVHSASWCLKEGGGSCGDFSALFVALCRAAGVPARPVTGLWSEGTDRWHCWAEFMLPGGQWIPVDLQMGSHSVWSRRRYFGWVDNQRVAFCKTYDVSLPPGKAGPRTADILQIGCFWWHSPDLKAGKQRPGVKFSAVSRETAGKDGRF